MSSKRTKLLDLDRFRRRLPQVSQSALAKLISIIRDEGLPELGDCRNDFRMAREAVVSAMTPYGPMLQSVVMERLTGGTLTVDIIHPLAFLYTACRERGGFSNFVKRLCAEQPSSVAEPWRLLFYTDEVTPGNPMGIHNKRKIQALYWSLSAFGVYELSHEDAWFPFCTVRSDQIKLVHAGLSRLVEYISYNAVRACCRARHGHRTTFYVKCGRRAYASLCMHV
jgi:hypothetical protein